MVKSVLQFKQVTKTGMKFFTLVLSSSFRKHTQPCVCIVADKTRTLGTCDVHPDQQAGPYKQSDLPIEKYQQKKSGRGGRKFPYWYINFPFGMTSIEKFLDVDIKIPSHHVEHSTSMTSNQLEKCKSTIRRKKTSIFVGPYTVKTTNQLIEKLKSTQNNLKFNLDYLYSMKIQLTDHVTQGLHGQIQMTSIKQSTMLEMAPTVKHIICKFAQTINFVQKG